MAERDHALALVLSGGNALGAYHAGAYQALSEHGLEPDWVVGASIGAITGAVICGNAAEQRIAQLRALWGVGDDPMPATFPGMDEARRTGSALRTLIGGHPGMFVPRHLFGPWWNPFGNPEASSLYDATPLQRTLEQLVDFERLNRGAPRLGATAVDLETGEDVVFDTRTHSLTHDHIRASSALLPAFSPVEIGGRLLGDAGISVNLPLDVVLAETPEKPLLCVAIDLLPLQAPRPNSLGETVSRMQDLVFATQSRRAIAAWQAIFDERVRQDDARSITLLHIAYSEQQREVSGKAFDFSAESSGARWSAGYDDLRRALDQVAGGKIPIGRPGLSVYCASGSGTGSGALEPVHWAMAPVRG